EPYERPQSASELSAALIEAVSEVCDSPPPSAAASLPTAPPVERVPARATAQLARPPEPALEPAPTRVRALPPRQLLLHSELSDDPSVRRGPITLSADDGKVLDRMLRRMQRRADFPSFLNNVTEISRKADADADYSAWQ